MAIYLRFTNLLQAYIRRQGIGTVTFLNDYMIISTIKEQCFSAIAVVRKVLAFCGCKLNVKKSDTHGHRQVEFNGVLIDFERWTLSTLEKKINKTLLRCEEILEVAGDGHKFRAPCALLR